MNKKIRIMCPVCDSNFHQIIIRPWVNEADPVKLYGAASGIQGTQQLVRCLECEMIFENPRYSEDIIVNGYMASNEAEHDSQYSMRVNSFYRALKKQSIFLPCSGKKVLDIGTAGGAFLEAAKKYGYNAYGLEPSSDLVARGRSRGLNIKQGTITKHNYDYGSFDMVCLWDVIEHLPDPKFALYEIRKLLKPDGVLLINFPDIGTWQAKLAGKKFWWLLSVHLHYFTKKTIMDICNKTGFEIFCFQKYWQILEFGYLEKMAIHYRIPLSAFITRFTPKCIQRIPIPYYASQTTALARLKK